VTVGLTAQDARSNSVLVPLRRAGQVRRALGFGVLGTPS